MQIKYVLMGIVSFLILVLGVMMIVFLQGGKVFDVGTSPTNLENCKSLGELNSGINFLFFADEATTREYSDYFFSSKPFDQYTDAFNVFYIDPAEYVPTCELYNGVALFCDSKELTKKAASCPNDYLIVLEDRPEEIRSSSYKNVVSIVKEHPKEVLLHEMGHAFVNLGEEYVDNNAKVPKGSKNCQEDCSLFDEGMCFLGCTKSSLYRSINEGVMRTLSVSDFGSYNEDLIKERVADERDGNSFFTGNVISEEHFDCSKQEYYLVGVKNGNIVSVSEEIGCAGTPGYGSDTIQVVLESGQILKEYFSNEIIFTTNPGSESGIGEQYYPEDLVTYVKVPKISDSEFIQVTGSEGLVTGSFDVASIGYYPVKQ